MSAGASTLHHGHGKHLLAEPRRDTVVDATDELAASRVDVVTSSATDRGHHATLDQQVAEAFDRFLAGDPRGAGQALADLEWRQADDYYPYNFSPILMPVSRLASGRKVAMPCR